MEKKGKARYESHYVGILLNEILLKEVMITPVVTVKVDEELSAVQEDFIKYKIRHIPVVDQNKKLVGLMTQRQLYRTSSPRKILSDDVQFRKDVITEGDSYYNKEDLDSYILKYVMLKNPPALTPNDRIADAIHIMVQNKLGCVPIINEKKEVCGIITRGDVLRLADQIFTDYQSKNKR